MRVAQLNEIWMEFFHLIHLLTREQSDKKAESWDPGFTAGRRDPASRKICAG
jgi:hypothetical protein